MNDSRRRFREPRFQQWDDVGGMPPPPPYGFDMTPVRDGPDWERAGLPLVSRWFSTVSAVFTKPTETFQKLKLDGGLGAPLAFGVIGWTIGGIAAALYQTAFRAIGFTVSVGGASQDEAMATMVGTGFGLICGICLAPVFAIIGLFIHSGIIHLMLMMLGGASRGFETTFRSVTYVSGATNLLNLIPGCGACVGLVWYIIALANALTHTHEIGLGKAYAAVLLPILLVVFCCGAVVGMAVFFGVLAAAANA